MPQEAEHEHGAPGAHRAPAPSDAARPHRARPTSPQLRHQCRPPAVGPHASSALLGALYTSATPRRPGHQAPAQPGRARVRRAPGTLRQSPLRARGQGAAPDSQHQQQARHYDTYVRQVEDAARSGRRCRIDACRRAAGHQIASAPEEAGHPRQPGGCPPGHQWRGWPPPPPSPPPPAPPWRGH